MNSKDAARAENLRIGSVERAAVTKVCFDINRVAERSEGLVPHDVGMGPNLVNRGVGGGGHDLASGRMERCKPQSNLCMDHWYVLALDEARNDVREHRELDWKEEDGQIIIGVMNVVEITKREISGVTAGDDEDRVLLKECVVVVVRHYDHTVTDTCTTILGTRGGLDEDSRSLCKVAVVSGGLREGALS
jgi:hypothetical protein